MAKQTKKRITPRKKKIAQVSNPLPTRAVARREPGDDFLRARERLHVSATPDTLPCREDEFAEILTHVQSALQERTGSCIYISGVPGTGKTATVHEVIRTLHSMAENQELPQFQFVEINGMTLIEPAQAYVQLWEAISGNRVTVAHAADLLTQHFSTPSPRHSCVILVDELDFLVTKKQDVMYNFFEWPNKPHSRLIVLAVANTMDLPERVLSNKVSSRLGLTRICFPTYNFEQLNKIVLSRLEGISVFDPEAIMLCARKVSAVSGDARRALDVCRRAVELVGTTARDREREGDGSGGDGYDKPKVTTQVINRVCAEMYASPNVDFVIKASLHQKLFLYSVLQALRRSGVGEAEFGKVAAHHREICRLHNIEPPTTSDFSYICAGLGASRCLLVEGGRLDLYQRIRLNVREEEIKMALKKEQLFDRLGL